MRWFTRRHPGVGGITSGEADALEAAASARVIELVPGTIEGTTAGRCVDCGRDSAPWFSRCDACQAPDAGRPASLPRHDRHGAGRSGGHGASGRDHRRRGPAAAGGLRRPPSRAVRRRRARSR